MPRNLLSDPAVPEISAGDPNAPRLNPQREAGFMARALAGIPITQQQQAAALERLFGKGNVSTDVSGRFFVFDPDRNEFFPVDRPDLQNVGDIADLSGMVIEALPTLGASTIGGAAAGAVGGNIIRQVLGNIVAPGVSVPVAERAKSAAIAGAVGGGAQAVVNVGARVVNAMRPSSIAATVVRGAAGRSKFTEAVRESETLEDVLGIRFTAGQRTQSRSLLTLEGMLRRNPASADIITANDEAQLQAAVRALNTTLDRISPRGAPPQRVGEAVKRAFDATLDRAVQLRRSQAAVDFGKVDALSGGLPVIRPSSTVGEIDRLISEFDVPGGGDATATLVRRLKALKGRLSMSEVSRLDREVSGKSLTDEQLVDALDRLGESTELVPDPLTASTYQRLLQVYSAAARGTGKLFKDIDTAQQRLVAARLRDALQADLDAAIDEGGVAGEIAQALATARDNYRRNSAAISELGRTTIARLVGDRSREFSADSLVSSLERMKSDQIVRVIRMVERVDPSDAQAVKRGFMERIIERAQPSPEVIERRLEAGQEIGAGISPTRLLTEIRRSPIWEAFTPEERFNVQQIVKGMQRLANRAGTEGSPTAPLLFARDMAIALMGSALHLDLVGTARLVAAIMAPRRLAETIVDPRGQQAWADLLREITKPRGQNLRRIEASALFLAGRPETEPDPQNISPDPALDALGAAARGGSAAPRNLLRRRTDPPRQTLPPDRSGSAAPASNLLATDRP